MYLGGAKFKNLLMISLIINEKLFIYAIFAKTKALIEYFWKDVAACYSCTTFVHLGRFSPSSVQTSLDSVSESNPQIHTTPNYLKVRYEE